MQITGTELVPDSNLIIISVKDIYIYDIWCQLKQFNLKNKIYLLQQYVIRMDWRLVQEIKTYP